MLLKNYIAQFHNVVSYENVSVLLRYANTVDYEKAKIGRGVVNDKIRNVSRFNITANEKSLTRCHWANYLNYKITQCMNVYLQKQNLLQYGCTIQSLNQLDLLKYEKDNHYEYHVDALNYTQRILSSILFLNNDYEGGELSFKNTFNDDEISIKSTPGTLVIWPSNFLFPHAVKPVKKGTRFTIVAWAA